MNLFSNIFNKLERNKNYTILKKILQVIQELPVLLALSIF
jgi:hypothetical protein